LTKKDPAGKWINDFVNSDNAKFKGKSDKERRRMALGAYYAKQNEEVIDELSHQALQNYVAKVTAPEVVDPKRIKGLKLALNKKWTSRPGIVKVPGTVKEGTAEVTAATHKYKVGDIVYVNRGPHANNQHKVVHLHDNGDLNVAPVTHGPVKYHLGAARVNPQKDLRTPIQDKEKYVEPKAKQRPLNDFEKAIQAKYSVKKEETSFARIRRIIREHEKAGVE